MTTASTLSEAVKTNFLKLDGGTMTGSIKKGGGYFIENIGTNGALFISNDATHNFTNFGVYGTNHESYPNVFLVKCSDGTNTKYLMGYPDGRFTWGGKNVVCVETWRSGTSWYRKYADGWIEQGGRIGAYSGTITFPVSFSNTNYTFLSMPIGRVSNNYYVIETTSMTTTSINVTWDGEVSKASGIICYACGY